MFASNWAERTAIKVIAKSQFWSSETTGLFQYLETHIYLFQLDLGKKMNDLYLSTVVQNIEAENGAIIA